MCESKITGEVNIHIHKMNFTGPFTQNLYRICMVNMLSKAFHVVHHDFTALQAAARSLEQNRCIWHESNICVASFVGDCISKIGGQSLQEMDDCESVFIDCLKDACKNLVLGGKTAKRKKILGIPWESIQPLRFFFKLNIYISFEKWLNCEQPGALGCMELACNI